jgi:hypothetical protein
MRKDLVEKIKKQLKSLFTQKFAEIKAGDMMISTPDEVLVVGSEVFMIDEQGLNVPLMDGEYLLDSGEKIEVVSGKVTEISVQTEEAPAAEEVVVEGGEQKMEVTGTMEEQVAVLKQEIELLKKMYEDMMAEHKKMYEDMMSEKQVMKEEFSKLAGSPSVKSIEVKPSEFKSVETKKTSASNIDLVSILEKAKKKVRG